VTPSSDILQLAFIDGLFLCLVIGLCLWFRAWLRQQQHSIDQRLKALDEQQQLLTRLGERLQGICRSLEGAYAVSARSQGATPRGVAKGAPPRPRPASAGGHGSARESRSSGATAVLDSRQPRTGSEGSGSDRRPSVPSPDAGWGSREAGADSSDDAYVQARDLLGRGMAPTEVARRLGLGIAEVNALQRLQQSR